MTEIQKLTNKINSLNKNIKSLNKQIEALIAKEEKNLKSLTDEEKELREKKWKLAEEKIGKTPFTKNMTELFPSVRLYNVLRNINIKTVADIVKNLSPSGKDSLLQYRNCGIKTRMELETKMSRMGIDAKSWEQLHNSLQN